MLTEPLIQVLSSLSRSSFIKEMPSILRCTSISEKLKRKKKKIFESMKLWPLPIPVIDHTCRAFLNSIKKKKSKTQKVKLHNINR